MKYSELQRRVYHKSNFLSIVLRVDDLRETTRLLGGDTLTHLIVQVKSLSGSFVKEDIMNLSPCYDKQNPQQWKPKVEPETYLTIESITPQLEYVPESAILGGAKIALHPGKTILIEGEPIEPESLPVIGTMVPI